MHNKYKFIYINLYRLTCIYISTKSPDFFSGSIVSTVYELLSSYRIHLKDLPFIHKQCYQNIYDSDYGMNQISIIRVCAQMPNKTFMYKYLQSFSISLPAIQSEN